MLFRAGCLCSARIRVPEPVLLGHGRLYGSRYFLWERESRLARPVPVDIRVSVTVQQIQSRSGDQRRHFSSWASVREKVVSPKQASFLGSSSPFILVKVSCGLSIAKPQSRAPREIHTGNMPTCKPFERLPKSVVPRHYELLLQPNLKTFVFQGKETVQVEVKEPTDKIVLNALDLSIGPVEYICGDEVLKPVIVDLSAENETLTLHFTKALPLGDGKLTIIFTGELNDKMKGFYRSKYTSPSGEERYAGVTQFEATDAHRCFPCWDEPALKATFDITLRVPPKKVALSNMPVVSERQLTLEESRELVVSAGGEGEGGGGEPLRELQFSRTPVMPTYLVAVVVGEFDSIETVSRDGVLVRVYTPVGKAEQGRFALDVASKVLPYYKDYFQIAYPLPKIDLIAIADFSAGAMENWGLVTYRETCLLVDPENTSAVRKQWIALVVGHELAHQWFGNLVTMEWWTHLWLNEGYASFVEFLCVEHLFPEYDIWTQFVTETYIRALELDCLKNSHPIEVPVGHPSEIDEIFDDISYNKGASVIRMLHRYIGDEDFRKGMNMYLTRHQYGNTFTEDLWSALEEASNKPVGAVMSTWTKQMGFPTVKVVQQIQEGPNQRRLKVTQHKFCADGSTQDDSPIWMVPLTFSTSKHPTKLAHQMVLETKSSDVVLDNVFPDDWVKVNPGTVGFYRTQYPSEMLAQFVPAIRDRSLPPLDRLGLLDDLFALVQAGQTPTVEVLKLMEAFGAEEDNFTVWSSISNCLGKLGVLLSHTDFLPQFHAYGCRLLGNVAARLGWDQKPDESHLDTLLRSLVLGRLGWYGEQGTIAEANRRFKSHASGEKLIPADLRTPVYKAVLSTGDQTTYDTMLKLYREADLHEEKDRISRALGAIKDEGLLKRVLEFAMSEEVRSQDTVFVIISVAMTKVGRELAWRFLRDNWHVLTERYQGGFLIARLVKSTTENFASEERALELEAFFREHPSPGTERTVQQSVETIRLNAAWLERDREGIRSYLSSNA
ncbi:puromycin-sensitive aminopeptidase [Hetaerina americana]|uniref:puromycin-sensitive aminopeptidase n=1 Tax=Hetaerina americana TaxID=62018 RepID=UPI003A7F40DA